MIKVQGSPVPTLIVPDHYELNATIRMRTMINQKVPIIHLSKLNKGLTLMSMLNVPDHDIHMLFSKLLNYFPHCRKLKSIIWKRMDSHNTIIFMRSLRPMSHNPDHHLTMLNLQCLETMRSKGSWVNALESHGVITSFKLWD
jgi:hypothetical protein